MAYPGRDPPERRAGGAGESTGATPPTFNSVNAEHARLVEQALRVGAGENRRHVAGTGADPERLGGIPAIGRSVSGAIRGTQSEKRVCR
jgi:hypothetical protein